MSSDFTIYDAKLKVLGDIQVAGSIVYTDTASGFGVEAQIDGNNTLNITASKATGVMKIERATTTTITSIIHTNVNNNTTIYIALKNTSSVKGRFITLESFSSDNTIKVNYTDEYLIAPGETGMLTLRKVDGVLSMFVREMFSSTAMNTATNPFYIIDGSNYKYPLYTISGGDATTAVTINGETYYRPNTGWQFSARPPKGILELNVSPTGNIAIGNNSEGTTVYYDVWGIHLYFDFGSIYKGGVKKASFVLEDGEASGSFTEESTNSGDAYSLYVERTDISMSDTVYFSGGSYKTIPKVSGISFDATNVTFTVQNASNITSIKYTINGGSEATTPVGTLSVAHGLSTLASINVVAYAVDSNGVQISTKKTVVGTIPFYAYPDIIISTAITDVPSTKITQFASSSVTVSSVSGFSVSDWVMIHQTYYPAGNSNTTTVCPYEFKKIQGISGTIITFTQSITGTFSDGAQMIYTYRCTDFTLNSGITMTTSSWDQDTYKGGIIPIYADGTVTINGTIDVSGKGYQGIRASYNEALRATVLFQEGFQGKGYDVVLRGGGVGGRAGAGGGGNAGGGGGGGHLNNGSIGNSKGGTNSGTVLGGIAFGSTSGTYLTMGGSGGQGGHHDIIGSFQRGGDGGGAVYVQGSTISGSGVINADGVPGNNNVGVMRWQGGAGGGAGGMVLFKTNSGTTPFTNVSINGGIGVPGTISNLTEQVSQTGGNGSIGRFSTVPI